MVKFNINFLASEGKCLLPYRRSCNILISEVLECLQASITSLTAERRFRLCSMKELQSSKKCFVSAMPSFTVHIGLTVSLKLYLNLRKLNLLSPTLD